ncbi:fibronectin type III domain-containing protein [Demequina sp. SO4-18]|uniref:fibronectin type III domain-containing protein n=1 Tax=Demequina sp. SO4-18 TaxID=3401026 RepID=UPI003B5CA219
MNHFRSPADLRIPLVAALAATTLAIVAAPAQAAVVFANTDSYSVPYRTSAVALSPAGDTLYVASAASGRIYVLDAATGDELSTLDPRSFPHDIALSADGETLVAASEETSRLTVFDADHPSGQIIDVPMLGSGDVAVSADGSRVLVPRSGGAGAAVIDRPSSVTAVPLGAGGDAGVAFAHSDEQAIASDPADGASPLAWRSLTSMAGSELAPGRLGATGSVAVSPADGSVAVAGTDGIRVYSAALDGAPEFVATAQAAHRVAYSPDGSRILAIGATEVAVVSADSMTTLAVARGAVTVQDAAMTPDNSALLVADGTRAEVMVFTSERTASPPTGLTVTPGDGEATVTWEPPTAMGTYDFSFYLLQVRSVGGDWTSIPSSMTTATSSTVSSLTNGEPVELRVSAYTGLGEGEWSDPITVTPAGIPGAPRALAASLSRGSVWLAWEPPAVDGGSAVLEYVVEERVGDGDWLPIAATPASTTRITLGPRPAGIDHAYRVSTRTAVGASVPSAAVTFTPSLPAPPVLTATPGAGSVLLSWTIESDEPLAWFTIEQRIDGGEWATIAEPPGVEREFLVDGLSDGSEAAFRITAFAGQQPGPTSEPVVVTVGEPIPAPSPQPSTPSPQPSAPEPEPSPSPTGTTQEEPPLALAQSGPWGASALAALAVTAMLTGTALAAGGRGMRLTRERRPS